MKETKREALQGNVAAKKEFIGMWRMPDEGRFVSFKRRKESTLWLPAVLFVLLQIIVSRSILLSNSRKFRAVMTNNMCSQVDSVHAERISHFNIFSVSLGYQCPILGVCDWCEGSVRQLKLFIFFVFCFQEEDYLTLFACRAQRVKEWKAFSRECGRQETVHRDVMNANRRQKVCLSENTVTDFLLEALFFERGKKSSTEEEKTEKKETQEKEEK